MGGIDLDPATSAIANKTVMADAFFTAETNGLANEWWGRVWMNPPYAQPLISQFAQAMVDKFLNGEIEQGFCLVNNGTETKWGQTLIGNASAVCFVSKRIRFLDPDGRPNGPPLQGQMLAYFGSNIEGFKKEFKKHGTVLVNTNEEKHELEFE